MKAIPAIAAYESWKLMVLTDDGEKKVCIISETRRVFPMLLYRPVMRAVSPIVMNRRARTVDGAAPVAKVYKPQNVTMMVDLKDDAAGLFPIMLVSLFTMIYIIPRCRPDRARIWDAPLERKASVILDGIPLLSPVRRAFIMADVSGCLKGMPSMCVCTF